MKTYQDQKGSQLFDRFCELIGLEKGDPECGLVYSTISNPKTKSNRNEVQNKAPESKRPN